MRDDEHVFIVDADRATWESVKQLVAAAGVMTQGFASAEEFLGTFDGSCSGCLIAEARLPGMSGLELFRTLSRPTQRLPVLMLTAFADVPLAVEAMSLGALAVFEKPFHDRELLEAISKALEISRRCRKERDRIREIEQRLQKLTADEWRILDLILTGVTNKEIAQDLQIGLRTVEARRHAIMTKLNAQSLVDIVRMVWETRIPDRGCRESAMSDPL